MTAFFAMGLALAVSAPLEASWAAPGGAAAPTGKVAAPPLQSRPLAHAPASEVATLAVTSVPGSAGGLEPALAPWAAALAPITVENRNTNARAAIRLYDARGALDREQARAFMRVAGRAADAPEDASDDDERLDLRLVQLAVRAAYHFGGARISIVSATRPGAHGKHGSGEALDFALTSVAAPALAAYLRGTPRAGVGIYTHPKTQYVHLDVRDESYHWLDGSPPGVSWRERLVPDPKRAERDAAYDVTLDLPEPP
ncbi:MAG: hypothetical protein JWP97_6067 [Labilithrix sp.]|nr:hypothetical protein [Labilithrix sp.]